MVFSVFAHSMSAHAGYLYEAHGAESVCGYPGSPDTQIHKLMLVTASAVSKLRTAEYYFPASVTIQIITLLPIASST